MKERILLVIQDAKITKTEFAKRLNVSQAFVSQMCSGAGNPSDRTVSDICRIFNVREEWLRYGLEPMRAPKTREEEVAELVGRAFADDNEFQQAVIRMICSRTKDELKVLENAFRTVCDQIHKEDRGE